MSYIVRLDGDTWLAPSNSEPAKSTMQRRRASRWATAGSARAALARARNVQPFAHGSIESTIAQSNDSLDVAFEEFSEIVIMRLGDIAARRQRLREFGRTPREPYGADAQVRFAIWLAAELDRVNIELSKVERDAVKDTP